MVRSNPFPHSVGFLSEDRRTNVAITRAKRMVCLVCDSETVSTHPLLRRAVNYFNLYGETNTAHLYESRDGFESVITPKSTSVFSVRF